MASTLEVKLRTAAAANSALAGYLAAGSPVVFRWYDMQEYQGSAFPAITVLLVSAIPQYSMVARLWNSVNRVQFTIWDTDPERARAVELALMSFLDQFNAMNLFGQGIPRQANEVLMRRQGGNPQTQPLTFWRIVDARIWHNETI